MQTPHAGRGRAPTGARHAGRAVLLLAASAATTTAQTYPTPTQNALAGSRVFGSKGCGTCHAIKGLGGTEGPDLAQTPRSRTFYDLAAAMWNHLPSMVERMKALAVERPHLNAREAGDLIAFLYAQDFFDPAGDSERGRRIFMGKQCVRCHQVRGVGAMIGPDLTVTGRLVAPIQIATAMWNHGPNMLEAMRAQAIERPRFTAQELNDLIAFFEAENETVPSTPLYVIPGSAAEGTRVFTEKGCAECHGGRGAGGRNAPDLHGGRRVSLLGFAAAMWNKAPAMTTAMRSRGIVVPQLSAAEMAAIVGYLYSVRYFAQSGSPDAGRRLASIKGCTRCHALRGGGGSGAPDLSAIRQGSTPAAVLADLWNHGLFAAGDPETGRPSPWPALTAQDIANLTAFLAAESARPQN